MQRSHAWIIYFDTLAIMRDLDSDAFPAAGCVGVEGAMRAHLAGARVLCMDIDS